MFARLATLAYRHPWWMLIGVFIFLGISGPIGGPVASKLQPAGFDDPASASTQARDRITAITGANPSLTLMAVIHTGADVKTSSAAQSKVTKIAKKISADPAVARVLTFYETHDPSMVSKDGKSTYVIAQFKKSSDSALMQAADRLETKLSSDPSVLVGGGAVVNNQLNHIVTTDLARAALLSLPVLFLLLLVVFRGVVAALLPLLLGVVAILGTFLLIRMVNSVVPLSVFILDIVNGLGLGLAIDYSLLILSRYREELALVGPGRDAIVRTLNTAGRTVAFSSITVMAALSSLMIFPQRFLYSMGVGGVLVTLVDALAALIALPALLSVLGPRVNSLAPKRWQQTNEKSDSVGAWYALSQFVMRYALIIAPLTALLLLGLGIPFFRLQLTSVNASVLPVSSSGRQVNEVLARDFPPSPVGHTFIVVDAPKSKASGVSSFQKKVAAVPNVKVVSSPRPLSSNAWQIDVLPRTSDLSNTSQDVISSIRALSAPFVFKVGGPTAQFVDYKASILRHLPLVLGIMALALFVVLFLVTGSVILPIKSFIMNLLTISATFGSLVLIFQDGRFENILRYTSDNALESSQPILIFVIGFALSTDYGVFLLARIREARTLGADNERAVASGIQYTGRIVTAAALLFCVAMGSFATSQIAFIKQLGVGVCISVILDATLVRAFLVPSLMRLLGNVNWWAPAPLRWIADRVKIEESALPPPEPVPAAPAPFVPQPMPQPPQLAPQTPLTAPTISIPSTAPQGWASQTTSIQIPPLRGSFVVEVGPRSGTRLGITAGTTIGRDPRATDVVLPDPLVSGTHAQVRQEGGQLVLYDTNSRNGIYVRGSRVKRYALRNGDLIGMGGTILRYVARDREEPRSAAATASPLRV